MHVDKAFIARITRPLPSPQSVPYHAALSPEVEYALVDVDHSLGLQHLQHGWMWMCGSFLGVCIVAVSQDSMK